MSIKPIHPERDVTFQFTEEQLNAAPQLNPLKPGTYDFKVLKLKEGKDESGKRRITVIIQVKKHRIKAYIRENRSVNNEMYKSFFHKSIFGNEQKSKTTLKDYIGKTGQAELQLRKDKTNFVRNWVSK